MTLIAIRYSSQQFIALSDSRVSHKPNGHTAKVTDYFTKLFQIPYRFSVAIGESFTQVAAGKVGFSFAGDVTIAIALQSVSTNILQNMFDPTGNASLPSFEVICDVILRSAEILHDDTVFSTPRIYEAYIFGFCPLTSDPKISKLSASNIKGIFKYEITSCEITNGSIYTIGSGHPFLIENLSSYRNAGKRFEIIFRESVENNPDPATGGAVQMLVADADGVEHAGVLQASEDKDTAVGYLGGINISDFGTIGGYTVGRTMVDIGASEVANRISLRRLGYNPDDQNLSGPLKNMAAVLGALNYAVPQGKPVLLDQILEISPPSPSRGTLYFSRVCSQCFRLSPILIDERQSPGPNPFLGQGGLKTTCIHCNSVITLSAGDATSQIWQ